MFNKINSNNEFSEFPLNLLPEVSKIVDIELLFLIIILHISILKYLNKTDYNKYIPNNKIGKIITTIINRYITMSSIPSNNLLVFSWIMLFFCAILLKICMFYIFNSY
jgi:hypothetical protein